MTKTLYKKSKTGRIQEWTIEVVGNSYRTHEGFVGGKITPTEFTYCKGKNIGKSNETTAEQQALKDAESKIKKQKDRGWCDTKEEALSHVITIVPMLAQRFQDRKDEILGWINQAACQPKLDGVRCIITRNGMFTRQGKEIVSAPHIFNDALHILNELGDTVFALDGELYNHNLKNDFDEIVSIVKKLKPREEDFEKSKKLMQFHCYDVIPSPENNLKFKQRYEILKDLILKDLLNKIRGEELKYDSIKLVPTKFHSDESKDLDLMAFLDTWYQKWLTDGYEGQMIRYSDSEYEMNIRSKFLIKRKETIDGEFEIVDIEEGQGNRSGMMGRFVLKLKDGRIFESNARGTHEKYIEWLDNKHLYIGKMATVRYQNLTPDGKPRFPVLITIRDYE